MGNFIGGVAKFVWGLLVLAVLGIKLVWLATGFDPKPKYEFKPLPTFKTVDPYKPYDFYKPLPTYPLLTGFEPQPKKYSFEETRGEMKRVVAEGSTKTTKPTASQE